MSPDRDIGAAVRARRTALGLTQAALAQQLGVSPETVCRWELGKSRPRRQARQSLAVSLATRLSLPAPRPRPRLPRARATTIATALTQVATDLRAVDAAVGADAAPSRVPAVAQARSTQTVLTSV
ncbi:MAG: helix-turn-helix transcriptional regulator [Candidatus Rokuibacteriota bacterium]